MAFIDALMPVLSVMMNLVKTLAKELDHPAAAHSTRVVSEVSWDEILDGR